MSLAIEKEFINRISYGLSKFSWSGNTAKFRCPYCGDSKRNTNKARGHLYVNGNHYFYKCFNNCDAPSSFTTLLKKIDPVIHGEYQRFRYVNTKLEGETVPVKKAPMAQQTIDKVQVVANTYTLDQLDYYHPANTYIRRRMLPDKCKSLLRYTDNFSEYCYTDFLSNSEKLTEYTEKNIPKDKRIIIPYQDRAGNTFMVQGRSVQAGASLRYVTIRRDDTIPKIYGLDKHVKGDLTFITEGPFDSMFLPNGLAMGGVGLSDDVIENYIQTPREKIVMVYDNEPRSKEITNHISNAIQLGVNVVIWNDIPTSLKDINAMILSGMSTKKLYELMADRIHHGAKAMNELAHWKKIKK